MIFSSEELINIDEDQSVLKKCSLVAQDITCGRLTILQLIEELGVLLVNTSPSKRSQGVLIFTEVLQNIPSNFLNIQQLRTISIFYTEKLSDHHQILPVLLKGILKLIEFTNFPEEMIPSLLNTLFLNVACQQQQQADRYTIYKIFQLSLEKYKEALISMKLDLVYGVISSIDGERDPRNLLFLFKWLPTFLTNISLGHLTEEMFEVMACYFPIDFKVPPSNAQNITREELADELCQCLCAIPEFSEYCIPLALEKLESSLQIAKLDSLNLLREGCSVFLSSSYLMRATEIWSQLQKEVFSDVDNTVKAECLKTLTAVIKKISQSEGEHFMSLLSNITTTLKGNLLPDSKLFPPSVSILLHTALASEQSSIYVTKEIVPLLTNMFVITHEPTQKAVILKTLVQFVKARLKYSNERIFLENEQIAVLPSLCLKACMEVDNNLRSVGFDSLAELIATLSLDFRLLLYKQLHDVIIKPEPVDVRETVLKCLKNASTLYPDEVNNNVLYNCKIVDCFALNLYLDALCYIIDLTYFREVVVECLITYSVTDVKLATTALQNIKNVLEKEYNNVELLQTFKQKNVISKLIDFAVIHARCSNDSDIVFLLHLSSVLKILIGWQDLEEQNKIITCQMNVISSYEHYGELYVLLIDGLISRTRQGLSPDPKILAFLSKISITNDNTVIRDVSIQFLANLVNKYPDGHNFIECLNSIKQDLLHYVITNKSEVITALSWITKALVMRNHSEANLWIETLLQYLEQDSNVAKGFKIIMNDSYESLSPVSYCNKTLLYQQKFFVLVTNKLCTNFKPGKIPYLIAVGYLIEYVSEQALLLQFNKIFQLVVLCLEQSNDPEVLCVILKRIKTFAVNNENILQEHLEDFLLRILALTTYESSMNVRIAALQCLIPFSSLPLYKLVPFKQKVLQHLELCIDDKKRLVRKEAMEARSIWFLLGAEM